MRAPRTVTGSEGRAAERDRSEVRRLSSRLPHFIQRAAGTADGADIGWEFDGTSSDTDAVGGIPADELVSTDGLPPASSPVPIVEGGQRFLCVQVVPISNDGPVTYEYHVSDTTGFTPDATTLVTETRGWMQFIRSLTDGTPLEYGTDYYVRIVAKDADGSAAPSAEVSGQLDPAGVDDILAGAVTAEKLAATIVLASLIQTAGSGQRVEVDTDGVRLFDTDGTTLLANLPTDGTDPYFAGELQIRGATFPPGSEGDASSQVTWLNGDEDASRSLISGGRDVSNSRSKMTLSTREEDAGNGSSIIALFTDDTSGDSEVTVTCSDNAFFGDTVTLLASDLESDYAMLSDGKQFWKMELMSATVNIPNTAAHTGGALTPTLTGVKVGDFVCLLGWEANGGLHRIFTMQIRNPANNADQVTLDYFNTSASAQDPSSQTLHFLVIHKS